MELEQPAMQDSEVAEAADESLETEQFDDAEEAEQSADDNDESDAEQEESDEEEIEYDGEKYKVPKALREAFLRQQDYTQKTQAVAEQRRALEAQAAEMQREAEARQQLFAEYAEAYALDNQLKQYSQIDWAALIESDPQQAMLLDRQMRELQQNRDNLVASFTQKQQQQALQAQQEAARRLQEGRAVLERDIKGWSPEVAKQLNVYGQEAGFSAEELSNVSDPRYIKVLHKAWQFDQMMKQQATKPKPAPQEKPVTRITASKGTASKDPSQMSQEEFEAWRKRTINRRSA